MEDHNPFTRNLFSADETIAWFLWNKDPGIYIRSTHALEDLRRHFRKFTRLMDDQENWYYFRFWEAVYFRAFLENTTLPNLLRFFGHRQITSFHVPLKGNLHSYRLKAEALGGEPPNATSFQLDLHTTLIFAKTAETEFFHRLYNEITAATPMPRPQFDSLIETIRGFGFSSRSVISDLAEWAIARETGLAGEPWVEASLDRSKSMPEAVRFARLRNEEPEGARYGGR